MTDTRKPHQPVPATGAALRPWGWRAAAVAAGATVFMGTAAWAAGSAPTPAAPAAAAKPAGAAPATLGGEPCPHGMHMGAGPEGERHGQGGHRGMGGPGMMWGGPHLDRLLGDVKATDAQRTQIRAITDKARTDVQALHEQGRQLHEAGLALWAAPKLDEQAIAAHRQKMNALHEQVSARMSQAMLDAAKVLQPEQRAELVKRMQAHEGRFERMKAHFKPHRDAQPGQPGVPASGPVH